MYSQGLTFVGCALSAGVQADYSSRVKGCLSIRKGEISLPELASQNFLIPGLLLGFAFGRLLSCLIGNVMLARLRI